MTVFKRSSAPFARPFGSKSRLQNERGQGLIEYLIIVALIAVATIGAMRVIGKNVNAKLADVNEAIRGNYMQHETEKVDQSQLQKRDLGNFMTGVGRNSQN